MHELTLRSNDDAILSVIQSGARVLDLGCGNGKLLERLVAERQVIARGVEINEQNVRACISRGLSVRQGNIEEGLADFRDNVFDYVILSDTIAYLNYPAPAVTEMLRVGKRAIVSFTNAAYVGARQRFWQGQGYGPSLASGEPRARAITPAQFREFAYIVGANIELELFVQADSPENWKTTDLLEPMNESLSSWVVYVLNRGET
jgi:methionine biosynthesis protein MetW